MIKKKKRTEKKKENEKVQVGKDQEKAPTPKSEVGKNQTYNQALIP